MAPISPSFNNILFADWFANGSSTGGIQEAHNLLTTGGTIVLSAEKIYDYTAGITISNPDISIIGQGLSSIVRNAHATGFDAFTVTGARARFMNFKVDGQNGSRTNGRGITIGAADDVLVSNMWFVNTCDACVGTNNPAAASARLRVLDCFMDSPGDAGSTDGYGVILNNSTNALVQGNVIKNARAGAIFGFNSAHRARVIGNYVDGGLDNGIRWDHGVNYWIVLGNTVVGVTVDGFRFDGNYSVVEGNISGSNGNSGFKSDGDLISAQLRGNYAFSNSNKGFYLTNANGSVDDVAIDGNLSEANTGDGIRIDLSTGGNYGKNIKVADNKSYGNSAWGLMIDGAATASSIYVGENFYHNNTSGEESRSFTNLTYLPSHFNRIFADKGQPHVNGDWALSAGWGATATAVVASGCTDNRFRVTITANGAGIAANPTATLTFKDGTFTNAPFASVGFSGGTGVISPAPTWTTTATTLVITFVGTPVAGSTYIVEGVLLG